LADVNTRLSNHKEQSEDGAVPKAVDEDGGQQVAAARMCEMGAGNISRLSTACYTEMCQCMHLFVCTVCAIGKIYRLETAALD